MVRKEAYQAVEGYSVAKKLLRVEDYHLWVKMYAKGYKGMNIQESLYGICDTYNKSYSNYSFFCTIGFIIIFEK